MSFLVHTSSCRIGKKNAKLMSQLGIYQN